MKLISSALVKAQKEFAPALKTSTNPHFKSKYVSLDGCIEAVIDALNNNGIFLMQRNHNCDNGVTVETIFIHESGEEISGGILHVPAIKNDPQAYGSALTYARRYSLMAACGIAPADDDGEAASRPAIKQSLAPKLIHPTFNLMTAKNDLVDCKTENSLKIAFAHHYPLANIEQKLELKTHYDNLKLKLIQEN